MPLAGSQWVFEMGPSLQFDAAAVAGSNVLVVPRIPCY